jgi:hypothetical protein
MKQKVSFVCWILIQWFVICQVSDLIRYTFGPLPAIFCGIIQVTKTGIKTQLMVSISPYVIPPELKKLEHFNDCQTMVKTV